MSWIEEHMEPAVTARIISLNEFALQHDFDTVYNPHGFRWSSIFLTSFEGAEKSETPDCSDRDCADLKQSDGQDHRIFVM